MWRSAGASPATNLVTWWGTPVRGAPAVERRRLNDLQATYGVKWPANEAEAAIFAFAETQRLLEVMGKKRGEILRPDRSAVWELLLSPTGSNMLERGRLR